MINTNAETDNRYLEIDQFETGTDRHSHLKQNGERMMADLNRSTTAALFQCGAAAPKNDRSLLQIFRRRLQFAARYFEAKKRSKLIQKLLPILERSFEHPWVIAVELQIRFGRATRPSSVCRFNPCTGMRQLLFPCSESEGERKDKRFACRFM